jgi:hypothetical protein
VGDEMLKDEDPNCVFRAGGVIVTITWDFFNCDKAWAAS